LRRFPVIIAAVAAGILLGLFLRAFREGKRAAEKPVYPPGGVAVRPARIVAPRIALVLDDWGYNLRHLDILAEIEVPVTLAVLPELPFSEEVCRQAPLLGCQVILHFPMASSRKGVPVDSPVVIPGMNRKEVVRLLEGALSGITGAVGISNHMGSAATADAALMRVVMGWAAGKGLFFLDSLTTPHSVCLRISRELKMKCYRRDVFLDTDFPGGAGGEYEEIAGRLRELGRKAEGKGRAVGIGHDRELTLKVIRDLAPEMEREGFRFVYLSELSG
jgi:polysaccharide deacetylase 2 family uncharacterized protein YibQ